MLQSPCSILNIDLKFSRMLDSLFLGSDTKLLQYLRSDKGEVPSETWHDSSYEPLLSFNCPVPQGLLGDDRVGLNIFSRGMKRGLWETACRVRCCCSERNRWKWVGGSGADKEMVGSQVVETETELPMRQETWRKHPSITWSRNPTLTDS